MTLGFVIGESKPTLVSAQTSRSLPIGEYVIIDSQDGKIVGLAEKSVVSSAALGDVKKYDEAFLTGTAAEITPIRSIDEISFSTGDITTTFKFMGDFSNLVNLSN